MTVVNCLYCATLHCRHLINSRLRRVHHDVACSENNNEKLRFLFFCSAVLCPAILRLAIWSVNSRPAISCPAILMVRHFHVRHFQSTSLGKHRLRDGPVQSRRLLAILFKRFAIGEVTLNVKVVGNERHLMMQKAITSDVDQKTPPISVSDTLLNASCCCVH